MRSPSPVPGGTVTFLFSDIEGSTRLEESVGTATYGELRERHRAIVRGACSAHGGQEQGTEGDSFFVVFASAREAVSAAVEATRGLAGEAWPDGAAIRVRMGLHSGEATMVGGSLLGLDINRAARIAAAGHGGQILVSAATRSLVEGALPDGAALRELGEHRLKDLRAPERIHQVVVEGLPDAFPALRTLDARPNNLPVELTPFVGRETELHEARQLLAGTRLLTLTGPGGTGKTRLSLELAATLADQCPDGVFFVPLEPVRDPALVAPRILASLGLTEVAGRHPRDVLVEWLSERRVLLVLDNFEQVLDAGAFVGDLVRSVPDLRLVVTSRAALRVYGEQEYPVPGLPVPPVGTGLTAMERANLRRSAVRLDARTASDYESVRLFVSRAMAVRPNFQLTDANAPAISEICARLQGMPLAIELAAARIRILPPDAILARLGGQLDVLAGGARDLPERQQTIRGAIAWSYEMLDEGCRRLLDRLSVFRGGCDLDAAEAVCGPPDEIGIDVFGGLSSLLDQSLVRLDQEADEPRFHLLETIREFGAEQLAAGDEAELILDRREAWFLHVAEEAAQQLSGTDQRAWLTRLEREHDNLRAVLDRSVRLERADPAVRLAFALWRFWQKRGHLNEARRRLEAIEAAPWSRADPRLRARLMEALGGVYWWQADMVALKPAYGEALALWRQIGDKAELANALYNYSFAFAVSPDPKGDPRAADPDGEGARAQEEALALYRELGDRRGEANLLWGMGNSQYFAAEEDAGAANFGQALAIFRAVGDTTMEAWSLHMLGGALLRMQRPNESRPHLHEALRTFQAAGDAAGIALVLDDLTSQAVADGDPARAARIRGAARRLSAETGTILAVYVDEQFEAFFRPGVTGSLPPDELQRLGDEGAEMPLDAAISYALGADFPPEGPAGPTADPSEGPNRGTGR